MNDSKPVSKLQKMGGGMGIRYTAYSVEEHSLHSRKLRVFRESSQEFKIWEILLSKDVY